MWGMNPAGYRAVNITLHIIESLLIWFILRKLLVPGAFLAGLFFALHPVNVESVAWIAQLKDMLAMLFFLLSVWCYIKDELSNSNSKVECVLSNDRPWGRSISIPGFLRSLSIWYWLSVAAFVLAMLSKGSAAPLPAILLGIVWWIRPVKIRDLVRVAPFFAISAALAVVNIWFQTHGSGDVIRNAGPLQRLLGAGGVVWFYLYKAILPFNLCLVYPQWRIRVGNPLWWAPLIAALAVTAVLWRYRKGWSRPYLFAWGFFCVALAPVMGFTDVGFMQYTLVTDHYQHIAIIGVIALAAAGCEIWRRGPKKLSWAAAPVAIAAVGTLFLLTWQHNRLFGDVITLYQSALDKNPESWFMEDNLGHELIQAGRKMEAREHFKQALLLKPDEYTALNNMGLYLLNEEGKLNEAMELFREAIKNQPKIYDSYVNMGIACLSSNHIPEAIYNFEKALSINPYCALAYNNMGIALAKTGRVQAAIDNYEKALNLKPDYMIAHNNLGMILLGSGQPQEAIAHFKQALQLAPRDAETHKNMAMATAATGRTQEAVKHFEQALAIDPDFAEAHFRLGLVLADVGRKREAIEHFEQALRFDADHPEIQYNLGLALDDTGRVREAIDYFGQVLKLQPDYMDAYFNLMLAYAKTGQTAEAVATGKKALELARSKGDWKQAKKIEEWLSSYGDGPGDEGSKQGIRD